MLARFCIPNPEIINAVRTAKEYVDYLRAYASHFRLTERIHLQSKVVNISRNPDGGHIVRYVTRNAANASEWETGDETLIVIENGV